MGFGGEVWESVNLGLVHRDGEMELLECQTELRDGAVWAGSSAAGR